MSHLILLLCPALKALNSVVQSSHLMLSWCTSSGVSLDSYYWDLGRPRASGVWTVSSGASTLGWGHPYEFGITHAWTGNPMYILQVEGGQLWWSGRVHIQGSTSLDHKSSEIKTCCKLLSGNKLIDLPLSHSIRLDGFLTGPQQP
ncbi:hypothetical protein DFH08DRAFT_1012886 [Mycena albidolilacea]|uniref:Uncharacterized protein n=1 Tax=Mycena albidolilacea TaxID=1033008 RepID=A0AAD7EMR6_9AGAR|nr:hypothetical protein DFH08DRAFT_1012886 [Mycena albidolilacea]